MATTRPPSFTPTHRVIDWVHRGTADVRTNPHPTGTTSLADPNIHVIQITDLTDGRSARAGNAAHFARGQSNLSPLAIASVQRGVSPG
jgi:hypothetical protein